jgi:membrane glycosyltransferase
MDRTVEYVTRYSKLAVCLVIAAASIWRANDYVDPKGPSMIPVVMCTMFAMAMTFTGFALSSREQE